MKEKKYEILRQYINLLANKEREVLDLIYGLSSGERIKKLTEVASLLNMSPVNVGKIRDRALRKLYCVILNDKKNQIIFDKENKKYRK